MADSVITLRQSIIDDRLDEYVQMSGDKPDLAFTKLAYSILRDCDYDELQPEEIVDGGEDKQLDVISIEEDSLSGIADVLILQTKNTTSFSSTALTLLGNGLSWVFEKRKSQYQGLRNIPLVRKIDEIREFRNRSGPSNMSIRVIFVTKGDASKLPKEFSDETEEIRTKYKAGGFLAFDIAALGAWELVELLGEQERRQRQIDDKLPILYDLNKPSYIRYSTQEMNGYICTARGSEIARLVSGERE